MTDIVWRRATLICLPRGITPPWRQDSDTELWARYSAPSLLEVREIVNGTVHDYTYAGISAVRWDTEQIIDREGRRWMRQPPEYGKNNES